MSLRLQGRWSGREDKFPLQCSTSVGSRLWFSAVAAWDFAVFVFHFGDSFCPAVYFDFFHDKVFDRFVCFSSFHRFQLFIHLAWNWWNLLYTFDSGPNVGEICTSIFRGGAVTDSLTAFLFEIRSNQRVLGGKLEGIGRKENREVDGKELGHPRHSCASPSQRSWVISPFFCCLLAIYNSDIQKISNRLSWHATVTSWSDVITVRLHPWPRFSRLSHWQNLPLNFCLPPRSFPFCVATLVCSPQTRSIAAG